MKRSVLDVIAHEDLTEGELCELRRFFDSEYFDEYGEWDPEQPYGYSLHDVHVIASLHDVHVIARRRPRGRECGMGPP